MGHCCNIHCGVHAAQSKSPYSSITNIISAKSSSIEIRARFIRSVEVTYQLVLLMLNLASKNMLILDTKVKISIAKC